MVGTSYARAKMIAVTIAPWEVRRVLEVDEGETLQRPFGECEKGERCEDVRRVLKGGGHGEHCGGRYSTSCPCHICTSWQIGNRRS